MLNIKHRNIVLVDLDNTVADFDRGMEIFLRKLHPDVQIIPACDRRTFWYQRDYPEKLHPLMQGIYNSHGFYADLLPIEGAIEAINEMSKDGIEVMLCSANLRDNPYCASEKHAWVGRYLGRDFVERLILSTDKTMVYGRVLIDDNPNLEGIIKPSWDRVIFDRPYNRETEGPRLTDWINWREVILPLMNA